MKKLISFGLVTTLLVASHVSSASEQPSKVNNIIMIIADGMGPTYTTAYRYYSDDPNTEKVEPTIFDKYLVGLSSTTPHHTVGFVTDSAASATALASGIKTYNGAIGVDINKQPVTSVLQAAKKLGKKTGVVVTSQINHATPASYVTHNESRRNYNAIADSYIDNGINTDVILGGGWQYFIREDRDLVKEYQQAGFHYVDNYQQLASIPADKPVIGLFADKGLPWAIDDSNPKRLSVMTKAATKQLTNTNGYFLLIEASQVDWAGHSNDIPAAMKEMEDLDYTLQYLEGYVEKHPNTLVVLTADHSTGGITLGRDSKYKWHPNVFKAMNQSPETIAKLLSEKSLSISELSKLLTFELTADEFAIITETVTAVKEELTAYNQLTAEQQKSQYKPKVTSKIAKQLNQVISKRSFTGWTTGGHTAIDVPIISFGKNNHVFSGKLDNTEIAKAIFKLL